MEIAIVFLKVDVLERGILQRSRASLPGVLRRVWL